jgi:hypothetical protein
MPKSAENYIPGDIPDKEPPAPKERPETWPVLVAGMTAVSAALVAEGGAMAEVIGAPPGSYFVTAESLGAGALLVAVYGTWRRFKKERWSWRPYALRTAAV